MTYQEKLVAGLVGVGVGVGVYVFVCCSYDCCCVLLCIVHSVFYSLGPIADYIHRETFGFMKSLPAMYLGLRFCVSRNGGTGGGEGVHPKGANSMVASGLIFRSNLVGTRRAISILFGLTCFEHVC